MEEKLSGIPPIDWEANTGLDHIVTSMKAAFPTANTDKLFAPGKKYLPPARPKHVEKENSGYPTIEPWDTDNQLPQRLNKLIKSNTPLSAGLRNLANEVLGQGVHTGIYELDDKTQEDVFRFRRNQKWNEFAKQADLTNQYEILAARSIVSYYMIFASLILNENGDAITRIIARSPLDCRLSKTNINGVSDFCYFSRQWKNNPQIDDIEKVVAIPVIDTWGGVEAFKAMLSKNKAREFMLVLRVPTDEFPYSTPDWLAVYNQKYLQLSNNIAIWKDALFKHLTTLNYVLYTSEWFYQLKYPQWEMVLAKAKTGDKESIAWIKAKRELHVQAIHDQATGLENTGKMIAGNLLPNPNNQNDKVLQKSFTIEPIMQEKLDGKFLPDANEADRQIFLAIDIDATQYGGLPGASDTGGSNKREGNNNSQLRRWAFEQIFIYPYKFIIEFNNYGDFEPRIKRAMTPTLDTITAKDRNIQQPK